MEKYSIKLNIKAIVYFEKLSSKPFLKIDYSDLKELSQLVYCCLYANNEDFDYSYEAFESVITSNKRIAEKLIKQFFKVVELEKQFFKKEEPKEQGINTTENSDLYIYKIIPILVTNCGLDINWVQNDMQLDDIGLYVDHYNITRQQQLQLDRLWCYYTILPHIGKKLKSPKDLLLFNWEKDESEKTSKALADEYTDKLKEILGNAKL